MQTITAATTEVVKFFTSGILYYDNLEVTFSYFFTFLLLFSIRYFDHLSLVWN
jgi:hypothetical protein